MSADRPPAAAGDPLPAAADRDRSNSTRHKARKRAVDILFEADLRGVDPLDTLTERTAAADPPVREYTADLVRGVVANQDEIDARIASRLSANWSLARLPRVDRAVLRIAVFELDAGVVPAGVVAAEAVALAGELSTDSSAAFVNGVLAAIARNASS